MPGFTVSVTVAVLFAFPVRTARAQGPLAPSSSPSAIFKSLQEVEPRTPISSLPFDISESGSYYVVSNLTGQAGTNGITITTDDVTLDLLGFSLVGGPGTADGICVPTPQANVTIRNGSVTDWGEHGVNAFATRNSKLENLRAYSNGWDATFKDGLRIGRNSMVVGCISGRSQDDGIAMDVGSMAINSVASDNADSGFVANFDSSFINCTANNNGSPIAGIIAGSGSLIKNCIVSSNADDGIFMPEGIIADTAANGNGGSGMVVGTVLGNLVTHYGATVMRCSANRNGEHGILAQDRSYVSDSVCHGNGTTGFGAGINLASFFKHFSDGEPYRG